MSTFHCKVNELVVPQTEFTDTTERLLEIAKIDEVKWTDHAAKLLAKNRLEHDDCVSLKCSIQLIPFQ